jgi:hypothetical protein
MLAGDGVDESRLPLLPAVAVTVRIGSPYTIISASPVFRLLAEVTLNRRLVVVTAGETLTISPAPLLFKAPTGTVEVSLKVIVPPQIQSVVLGRS